MLDKFGLIKTNSASVFPGDVFGRLTVIATGQIPGTYRYMAVCQCSCGSDAKAVRFDFLTSKRVLSCGCYHKEVTTTHGMTKSGHYGRHRGMMDRCYNRDCVAYPNYGGRGISVYRPWHDISVFVSELPDGYHKDLEIDRIDNDGNYEPGNIRWATRQVNSNNRRSARIIEYDGKIKSVGDWSKETKIPAAVISSRIDEFGWSIERALFEPLCDKIDNMRRAQSMRWNGHTKATPPPKRILKVFSYQGDNKTIRELSDITGISIKRLSSRLLEYGWSVERATKL